jgi:predicted flavoprotein YhiN
VRAARLVVASGGLSIPKIGASDWGYTIARRLGHRIVAPRPGLVPFAATLPTSSASAALAGVSLPVRAAAATRAVVRRGPALHPPRSERPGGTPDLDRWRAGETIAVDLAPGIDLRRTLGAAKSGRRRLASVSPTRCRAASSTPGSRTTGSDELAVAELRDRELDALASALHAGPRRRPEPKAGSKAEVTAGGVDTRDLDSRSCESRIVPGLHFIGEVVDVTGWLGGYNFQWAWASAAACARAMAVHCRSRPGGL